MKAVVIDDFRLARLELISMLSKHKDFDVVGEADNGDSALKLIQSMSPGIIFTDIDMPGMPVFEFLENIDENIQVVFTTAYMDHAAKSFCFNTVDYLLKPITQDRFDSALAKVRKRNQFNNCHDIEMLGEDSKIMVKYGMEYQLKPVASILRIESFVSDSKLYFESFVSDMLRPMSHIEKRLPKTLFYRISRQAIVNIKFIVSFIESKDKSGHEVVMSDGTILPVTRRQFATIKERLSI